MDVGALTPFMWAFEVIKVQNLIYVFTSND
jgi:hypothetical protein